MADYKIRSFSEELKKETTGVAKATPVVDNENTRTYTKREFKTKKEYDKEKKIKAESEAYQTRLAAEKLTEPKWLAKSQFNQTKPYARGRGWEDEYQKEMASYKKPTVIGRVSKVTPMPFEKYLEEIGQDKANTTIDPGEFERMTEVEKQKAITGHKELSKGYEEHEAEYKGMNPLQAFGYGTESAVASVLKFGEGVTDFVGAGASSILSDGLKIGSELLGGQRNKLGQGVNKAANAVKEFGEGYLKKDLVSEYEKNIKERYNPGKLDEKITGVGQVVTGMLPNVAIGAVSGGASLIPQLSNGLLAMGTSAAGNSASEAFKKTGDLEKSLAYGTLAGATEAAIEKAFGGIPELGGGALDNIVGKLIKNEKVRKVVNSTVDSLGEGAEEALSTLIDPFLKRATYDKNADLAKKEDVIESALLGALTSAVLGGTFKLGDKLIGKAEKPQFDPVTQKMLNGEIGKEPVLQSTAQGEKNLQEIKDKENLRVRTTDLGEKNSEVRGATTKSQKYQSAGERYFTDDISKIFGVPKAASRNAISPIVKEMSEAAKGRKVDSAKMDELFNKAYEAGVVSMEDYYNAYKDLKAEIKENAISLSKSAKADISNYNNFRKHNFQKVKISDDGVPVDVKYAELSERYPNLFSVDITGEAEQIEQIVDIVKGIEKTKVSLDYYYGEESEQFKEFARHEFDEKFEAYAEKMRYVERYENDQQEIAKKMVGKNATVEELKIARGKLKEAQRKSDKVTAKHLLTTKENGVVNSMLKGSISLNDLDGINEISIANVKALYEAKKEVAEFKKEIDLYNTYRKQELAEKADELIKNSENWKDKKTGIQYSRETMERNIEDIVKNRDEAKGLNDYYFKPIHENEANSNRFKNSYREKIRKLDLNEYESVYTQLYGEWKYHKGQIKSEKSIKIADELELKLKEFIDKNKGKINEEKARLAVEKFSKIYNELFEQVNNVLIVNGYSPVEYRKGYFPHFEDERSKSHATDDSPIKKVAKALGFDMSLPELPTDIAGLTHTFRPGKRWVANFLERTGETTDYDAILGFDRYIEGVSDVIHHTEDIQKLRQLENSLRLKYSDAGKQEEYTKILSEEITEEERTAKLDILFGRDITKMSHFVQEVRAYTDNLAGKKSLHDRVIESDAGRAFYQTVVNLENRIAGNMVAINPGSWLTNFIPLTQGGAQLSKKSMLKAARDTFKAYKSDDGFVDKSTFLTNRKGSNALYETTLSKMKDKLSSPMYHIDMFTSNVLTRARVYDNMKKQEVSLEDAMNEASEWTGRLMADRSKGALPTVFNRKNPLIKTLTMFQVEVNNQLSHLFKDIPRGYREKGVASIAGVLLQYVIGAFFYNELYESVVGRRPALDPIGMVLESFKAGEKGGSEMAIKSIGTSVLENTPFVGGLIGGGRVPVSSAVPDIPKLAKVLNGDVAARKKVEIAGKELIKPALYLGMPFGGGQVKKTIESTDALVRGGSYTHNDAGEKQLQFPVDRTVGNAAKGLLFGKYSQDGAKGYVDKSFKPYSVNQTKAVDALKIDGFKPSDATKLIDQLRVIKGKGGADEKRNLLLQLEGVKPKTKSLLDDLMISELKEKKDYSSVTGFKLSGMEDAQVKKYEAANAELKIDIDRFTECYDAIKNIKGNKNDKGNTISGSAKENKIAKLVSMGLNKNDAQKFYDIVK